MNLLRKLSLRVRRDSMGSLRSNNRMNRARLLAGSLGVGSVLILLFSLVLSSEAGFPTCTVRKPVAFGISDDEYVNGRTNVAHELQ